MNEIQNTKTKVLIILFFVFLRLNHYKFSNSSFFIILSVLAEHYLFTKNGELKPARVKKEFELFLSPF